jgi:hypothetical protein
MATAPRPQFMEFGDLVDGPDAISSAKLCALATRTDRNGVHVRRAGRKLSGVNMTVEATPQG